MAPGRGDALLEHTHLIRKVRLVSHSRWHTTQQSRNLRACLGETEDVVDEQKHILALHIAEVLRHCQRRKRYAKTGSRWLIHLAEDQCGLLENAGLLHLLDEVISLTGTLTNTCEYRHTIVVLGYTVDHLLNQNCLTNTGSTEETNLSTLHIRGEKVNDLDAGLEHLSLGLELVEGWWGAVDWPALLDLELVTRLTVEHITNDVEHLALGDIADWHRNRCSRVVNNAAADQTIGWLQRNGTNQVVTEVLGNLKSQGGLLLAQDNLCGQGVVDLRDGIVRELDVDHRSGNARDATRCCLCALGHCAFSFLVLGYRG